MTLRILVQIVAAVALVGALNACSGGEPDTITTTDATTAIHTPTNHPEPGSKPVPSLPGSADSQDADLEGFADLGKLQDLDDDEDPGKLQDLDDDEDPGKLQDLDDDEDPGKLQDLDDEDPGHLQDLDDEDPGHLQQLD